MEPSAQLKAVPIGYNPCLPEPQAMVRSRSGSRLHSLRGSTGDQDGRRGWRLAREVAARRVFSVDGLAPAIHSGGRQGARGCGQHVHKHSRLNGG